MGLSAADRDRLRAGPSIALAYLASPEPWVDCPGDQAQQVWVTPTAWTGRPGSKVELAPARTRAGVELAPVWMGRTVQLAPDGPGPTLGDGAIAEHAAGNVWDEFQMQRTEELRRKPPRAPALATATAFAKLARAGSAPRTLRQGAGDAEVALAPDAGAARESDGPTLFFEISRWVLVGCWEAYQPWFNVRATLVEPGSAGTKARVLWRAACGGTYPQDILADASPEALLEDGAKLYARKLDERAESCAKELFAALGAGNGAAK